MIDASGRGCTDRGEHVGGGEESNEGNANAETGTDTEGGDTSEEVDSLQDLQLLLTARARDFGIKVIVTPGARVPV